MLRLLLLVALLAGCTGSPGVKDAEETDQHGQGLPPGNAASEDTALPGVPRGIDLVGCDVYAAALPIPSALATSILPDGYTPRTTGSGMATVIVHEHECDAVVVDNATVVHNATFLWSQLTVRVNDTVDQVDGMHFYQIDAFVDNATLQSLFVEAGFEFHLATISRETIGDSIFIESTVMGETWYHLQAHQGSGGAPRMQYRHVQHYATDDGPRWIVNDGRTDAGGQVPYVVSATLEKGRLAQAFPEGFGKMAGLMDAGTLEATLQFGAPSRDQDG